MSDRPKALDLFCGAGGASMGLHRAGFEVTGVDIRPQPHYPFEFVQADALTFRLDGYDFIWASPPCQHYTAGLVRGAIIPNSKGHEHPDLIEPTRRRLSAAGIPYIIENVVGAPLIDPRLLCGEMFGLRVQRHRLFESNLLLFAMPHLKHRGTLHTGEYVAVYNGKWRNSASTKMVPRENMHVAAWADAMGIDWMTKAELSQAIPPAYSEFLGRQVIEQLRAAA